MSKKAVAATLLLTFLFALAPATGASGPAVPTASIPVEAEQTGEALLATATGGTNWSCVGAVLAFSFVAMGTGAATGGVGAAIIGAYAPVALVFCK
ncbi:MAG: hypothetical protein F4X59_05970 [Holophagales bacterium]|nr:hypothetical protein [Holophagales bacterium]MXX61691.1 hypothetical protein [Holophagales bacterium]MYC09663.1 hypothetical protein [Holophagales bacterium]MYD22648.1 hypothetical protein [Holophagales bacterium]MYI31629.1 hypothetical protein [Holophagales bacterium]